VTRLTLPPEPVGPVMVVLAPTGMEPKSPVEDCGAVSVIVVAALNAVGENVMLPAPRIAADQLASRSEQAASGVAPGWLWSVQSVIVSTPSVVSVATVTRNDGIVPI